MIHSNGRGDLPPVSLMKLGTLIGTGLGLALALPGAWSFAKADASRGVLLVANSHETLNRKGEGHIAVHDPETGAIVGTIADGPPTVHELAISSDSRFVYAPVYGDAAVGGPGSSGSSVAIIDLIRGRVVRNVDLGRPVRPHHPVMGPGGILYVTTELDQSVTMIDSRTWAVVGALPTGQPESHNVAVSRDGRRAYTSNVFAGTISIIDIPNRQLLKVLQVTPAAKVASGKPADWGVQRVAITPDDKTIYTCDWNSTELVAIDAGTMEVSKRLKLPSSCYGFAFTPDGKSLLTANFLGNSVSVVDLGSFKVSRTVEGLGQPQVIVVRPDGKEAYISCRTGVKIARLDLTDWTVSTFETSGMWPDGMVWANLPSN